MHPCQAFSANQDHFSLANASLNRLSCKSGSLFPRKMHPCQAFSTNQDHFSLGNASLPGLSCKSRSLSPRKCIPARIFPHIKITFPSQMHPCQAFSANQDHFPLANASLPGFSRISGSLFPRKCIPARLFLQIRIISHLQMHPFQTFSTNQDHFSQANASLNRLFCKSGSLFTNKTVLEYRQETIAGVIPQVPSPQSDNPCGIRFWKAIPHRRIRLQRSRRCRYGAGIHCKPLRQSPPCRLRSKDTCPSEAAF